MLEPMDQRDGQIWFDGALVPWREARPHVLTHGLHYGSAVFEGERAYGGRIFRLDAHTARLRRSAELLDFEIPWSHAEINAACEAVIAANGIVDGYVRPIAWRGSEVLGVSAAGTKVHMAVACWPWPSYFTPEAKLKGVRLTIADWRRPPPDSAPAASKATGLYIICTLAKDAALRAGYDDALMLDWRGQVAEATGANICLIIDGRLVTPEPDCFLDGITRRAVMELAGARGIPMEQRAVFPADLDRATEAFLAGTAAEITPIREIAGRSYVVGDITRQLLADFAALTQGAAAPASKAA